MYVNENDSKTEKASLMPLQLPLPLALQHLDESKVNEIQEFMNIIKSKQLAKRLMQNTSSLSSFSSTASYDESTQPKIAPQKGENFFYY